MSHLQDYAVGECKTLLRRLFKRHDAYPFSVIPETFPYADRIVVIAISEKMPGNLGRSLGPIGKYPNQRVASDKGNIKILPRTPRQRHIFISA